MEHLENKVSGLQGEVEELGQKVKINVKFRKIQEWDMGEP